MQTRSERKNLSHLDGWTALMVGLALAAALALFGRGPVGLGLAGLVGALTLSGFRIVQPNTALVATLFGNYAGILTRAGFFWILPFYHTRRVSLRTQNYHLTTTLKVNDSSGTPIEIAAAIVYHVDNPAAAVLDVENVHEFLQVQSESALRTLASHHPYNGHDGQESLSRHSEGLLKQLQQMVQERVVQTGIAIDEARFTHLTYAPEIAQAMLRRQQAEAVILARQALVRGAIEMIEHTVAELSERQIVNLNDADKAKLITSMMTVLLSEESAAPVLNVD